MYIDIYTHTIRLEMAITAYQDGLKVDPHNKKLIDDLEELQVQICYMYTYMYVCRRACSLINDLEDLKI